MLKQTPMVAGVERYYQFARCLRDEDLRGDRQFEFTQIDLEMSFVERDDVLTVTEGIIKSIMAIIGVEVDTPFPRMSYDEAMARFGSDKPDTRFGLEFVDLSTLFAARNLRRSPMCWRTAVRSKASTREAPRGYRDASWTSWWPSYRGLARRGWPTSRSRRRG